MKILTKEEKDMLLIALMMRRNCIETGIPHISAKDAKKMGKRAVALAKVLTYEQMELVLKTNKLVEAILTGEVHILPRA